MAQRFILGIGSGRCGTLSLKEVLAQQPDVLAMHEDPPLLPWQRDNGRPIMEQRFVRWRRRHVQPIVADVASFYLPYLEEAIAREPEVRIICLKRPREEVVESFGRWLAVTNPLQINHWAARPAPGWHHDPLWTRIFPKYDIEDREQGIRRYWEEYYSRVDELAARYPEHIRVFATHDALNTEEGQRAMLQFAGIPRDKQVLAVGARHNRSDKPRRHAMQAPPNGNPMDPRRCVVLVPYTGSIEPDCDEALKELERRGYPVRRVRGFAAIDQGRNQLATDAMLDGFEETMWIDADIRFHPNDVDRLRSHQQPIVCGIYAQKGKRSLACHALPGTPELRLGVGGGLRDILYAGTGFLLVRREVYLRMQTELRLPVCNERFKHPMLPYFQPQTHLDEDGSWYLAEDYAFCQRADECGYRVLADTTVRLFHIGKYGFGWEDAGIDRQRYPTFTLHLEGQPEVLKRE